jgi:lipopolysaccharide export system protein LptA
MNLTRRRLRKLLVVVAASWVVLLAILYRKPGARPSEAREEIAGTLAAEAGQVSDRMRFRDFEYVETRGSEGRYRLVAAEALRYEKNWERRFLLKDVTFESGPAGSSPGVRLHAPRAEFSEGSRAFRVFEGVEIASEESRLSGEAFRYEPAQRELVSEGPVTAQRGRLVIRADAGTVRTEEGTVVLTGRVRLGGRADGGEPLDLSAPRVELLRGGRISASGDGTVVRSNGLVVRARALYRSRETDGDRIRAEGESLLFLAPSEGRLPGAASVAGDVLDLSRDREGRPTLLEVSSTSTLSEVEVAPGPREPARTARAARFETRFRDGSLAEILVPSAVAVREAAGPDVPPGGGLRTLTAGSARLTFRGDRSLDVGLFEGGVSVSDGTRAALHGSEATLRGADDLAVVTGSPADYRDSEASLAARSIVYSRRDDRIDATGRVRASWSGERPGGLLGGREGGPVYSESETLRVSDGRKKLLLAGNVRAWQKENVLRCETLLVNDAERSLRAERNVRVFFRREPAPRPGVRAAPPETINASGDLLTHKEADRLVRIEGHSQILSGSWQIDADVTDLRLASDRSVEFAEARGSVVLEDRALRRHGEGTKATWRPEAEAVTLEGSPATAVDGKGNRTTGAVLTFRQGRSQVDVETGAVPSETTLKPEGS